MKSAFPKWLKRLDPLLEEIERTNPIYEAFRGRREAYRRARARLNLRPILDGRLLTMTALKALVLLLGVGLAPFSCGLTLILPISLFPYLSTQQSLKRRHEQILPLWVDGIFSASGVYVPAAVDLWLTGVKGRVMMEALYADVRERQWPVTLVVGGLVLVLLFAGMCGNSTATAETLLGVIPAIYLGYAAFLLIQCLVMRATIDDQIVARCQAWQGTPRNSGVIWRGIYVTVAGGIIFFCMCGGATSLIDTLFGGFGRALGSYAVASLRVRDIWLEFLASALLTAALLQTLCRWWFNQYWRDLDKALSEADAIYTAYMTDWVLEGIKPRLWTGPRELE